MGLSVLMSEVTSKDSQVKLNQATRCLLGRLYQFTIYFLQLILNVRVNNRELWQFMFHEVYYNHDSQNSFSVYYDSRTPKMVDHGVTKIPLPTPRLYRRLEVRRTLRTAKDERFFNDCSSLSVHHSWIHRNLFDI